MMNPKPPLGIMPKNLFENQVKEQRLNDLKNAISSYCEQNLSIKGEWIQEYNELVSYFNSEDNEKIMSSTIESFCIDYNKFKSLLPINTKVILKRYKGQKMFEFISKEKYLLDGFFLGILERFDSKIIKMVIPGPFGFQLHLQETLIKLIKDGEEISIYQRDREPKGDYSIVLFQK